MQTQTLQERVADQKDKLTELVGTAREIHEECGRDSDVPKPQLTDAVNWNKGWGKYGKT